MTNLSQANRGEFLFEARDIIDRLSRELRRLDAAAVAEAPDPKLVQTVFREVHTLKGLSEATGARRLGALADELELVIDELRMGRLEISAVAMGLLFDAVDHANRVVAVDCAVLAEPPDTDFDAFLGALRALRSAPSRRSPPVLPLDLEPGMMSVLTRQEEHRLRSWIARGARLHRVRITCRIATMDEELAAIRSAIAPIGEVVTYVPTSGSTDPASLLLELLVASIEPADAVQKALAHLQVRVQEVLRKSLACKALNEPAGVQQTLRAEEPAPSSRVLPQTVRVEIQQLDGLMTVLGELARVRDGVASVVERLSQDPVGSELARTLRDFDRHLDAMKLGLAGALGMSMGRVFEKLARVVRQASRDAAKEVNLVLVGAELEIDKGLGEELSESLMHLVRNALAHGLEPTDRRVAAGKPAVGTIRVNARRQDDRLVVELQDDGAGIDCKAIALRAAELGFLTLAQAEGLSLSESLPLMFVPGMSTSRGTEALSGRGVGMDVVKASVDRLGGTIEVQTESGCGTTFTLTLPARWGNEA